MADDAIADRYAREGFAVVVSLLGPSEVAALNREIRAVAGEDALAIHFPHKVSDLCRRTMHHPVIADLLTRLIGPDVKAIQSMLFVKAAGKPGQAWHQDEHFLPTRDRSLCGVWIALDDATIENGCLWVHPGSQEPGILYPMRPHGERRFDASEEAYAFPFEREGGTPVEIPAGGVLFFNGYLLHRSLPNRAPSGTRRALVFHYMSARSLLPWNHDGESPTDDFRDIEMVAGTDPYAWKGIADLSRPFVRAEVSA